MGVYDTIYFPCPKCGKEICAQSKSGDCILADYPAESVPLNVALDANRHAPFNCECGASWIFKTLKFPERISLEIIEYKEK